MPGCHADADRAETTPPSSSTPAYDRPRSYPSGVQRYDHQYTPEPRRVVIRRRLLTVPRTFVLLVAVTAALPLLVVAAAVVDGARHAVRRTPATTLRLLAFAWVFLAAEAAGILWMTATWVASGFGRNRRFLAESTWPVQRWWARTLLRAVERLFGIRFEVGGLDVVRPGPVVVMFRHASIIDNLLPAVLITDGLGMKLRWVVKRELLTLPSLDIAGKRLPNHFVDRNAADPRNELRSIGALAGELDPDEGVLIFPEGTRFTEAKRVRALDRMQKGDPDLLAIARRMRHVMPPRLGGALTLLDAGLDVVVAGHEGLGGFASIGEIWSGSLLGRTVPVALWRHPASSIPGDRKQRSRWLYERWLELDSWVEERKAQAS